MIVALALSAVLDASHYGVSEDLMENTVSDSLLLPAEYFKVPVTAQMKALPVALRVKAVQSLGTWVKTYVTSYAVQ